jgi:RHS repeat-associated protein
MFDMVVNGGGTFTLRYEREGYLTALRTTSCEWGDRIGIPDVFLLQAEPLATVVDLTATTGTFQVAQGSVQTDADGTRQATLLVPAGTEATLHAADGSTEILPSMNVRITEFTVGANGPGAMPAELPPESHYTHAFEIDADEAVDAGATSTTFSVPLIYYVDNYRAFPVGTLVPVGSLDRQTGTWRAEESGVVLKILSISAGSAQIDVTGDGSADSGAPLTSRGIGAPELQQLAQLYSVGKILQRIRIPHFSAYDCNLGVSCYPNVCPEPDQDPYPDPDPDNECNVSGASSINCQKQVLKESLPIAGTPYSLNYTTERTVDHQASYRVTIPLFGASVSPIVNFARVEAKIGPRDLDFPNGTDFLPLANAATEVVWDGRDVYGRKLQGTQPLRVTVEYGNAGCYTPPTGWAEPGLICVSSGQPLRVRRVRYRTIPVGPFDATSLGLGGWSVNVHHVYEPGVRRLRLGDGTHVDQVGLPLIISRVSPRAGDPPLPVTPYELEAAPDGTIYYSDRTSIRRIPPNGTPQAFAGGGVGFGGEGVPATHPSVQFNQILDLDLGPDGALYIADHNNQIVRKVGSDGIIRTFAGMPGLQGRTGDGGPATAARINRPQGVAARPDGSVFIAELVGVRRVSPDGIISNVAGTGSASSEFLPPDGTPATSFKIAPESIAVAPDGTIYLGVNTCFTPQCFTGLNRIVRIENGRFYHVAGQGCLDSGPECTARRAEGIAAKEAAMRPAKLAFDRQGQLYFIDAEGSTSERLRTIDRNGLVYTVAGARFGTGATLTNLGPAVGTTLGPRDLTLGPDGSFIVAASPTGALSQEGIFKITSPLPAESGAAFSVGGNDGRTMHAFDALGKHLSTRDSLTGAVVHGFSYGATGLLSTITDRGGLVTQIERDQTGKATAIVSPFGHRTELGIDANDHLTSIEDPEGNLTTMTYSSGSLLESLLDPRNRESTMEYDDLGRLSLDSDGNGGSHELFRTEAHPSWTVDRTTALGRTTTYQTEFTFGGSGQRSTITNPAGLVSVTDTDPADATISQHSDGTLVTTTQKPDSRFGMVAPTVSTSTKLPSGLTSVESSTRQYDSLSPSDPLTFVSMTDTLIRNGRSWTTTFNRASRTFTRQSPQGRTSTEILDTNGRTTSTQISTLAPTSLFYDPSGRLDHITQGSGPLSRTTTHGYVPSGAAAGYLQSVTDALTVPATYTRDALGRTLSETRASTTTAFSWDPTSNLSSVTPPGKPTHGMNYTPVNLLQTYTPPPAGLPASATSYTYDPDRMLRTETRPDGVQIVRTPDSAGRLDTVAIPGGLIDYDYYPPGLLTGSGKTSDILGPYGTDLHFTYDGMLTKSVAWSGDVAGSVAWNYDTDFNKILETVSGVTGTAQAAFGYDNDQLLTCASPTTCNPPGSDALSLVRSPQHGLITGITLGSTSETWTYNTFGELARQTATFAPSTPLVDITYDAPGFERDKLGRIVRKTEVIGGVTKVFAYTYDALRRLTDVTVNGVLEEHFEYDANGNRTLGVNATAGTTYTGVYDDQDRLLSYGPWVFTYTANGELETKTNTATGDEWLFQYDVLGNLLSVGLPNGDLVEYLVDGMGRRVGKKKNGVLLKQWIYRDALKPVAELDGSGALVSEFVYGSKRHVPDYVRRGSATYRVVSDQLGSPRYVVNVANSADVPFTASFASFGDVAGTGLDWIPFGFAGGIYDPDSGFVRFGRRDFDSTIGRWTNKDSLRFRSGRNFYNYVGSDPLNYLDPRGEFAAAIAVGVGAAAAFWGWFIWEYYEEPLRDAEDKGLPGPSDGPQDAYRHCLASCKLVQDGWGETMAENLGNLYEGDDASASCTMDRNNNATGRDLGRGNTPCETACLNAPLQNSP